MIVGILGDIVFTVSSRTVETLNNLAWSGSARYATHARHGGDALVEFCGANPDEITFNVDLSAYLGVNPQNEIAKIIDAERNGKTMALTIGNKCYGKYRWVITKHKVAAHTYDGAGDLTSATVSISLLEYLRG